MEKGKQNKQTEELEESVAQCGLVSCFINPASKGLLLLHKCVYKHAHAQCASMLCFCKDI